MGYKIANWDKYQGWKSEQSKRPDGAPTYPWFKVHRKILDSMDFFEVPEPIRWQWIGLLALSDDNGNISASDDAIAWRFRIKKFDPSPFIGSLLLVNNQISDGNGSASEPVPMENRLEERRGEEIEKRLEDKLPWGLAANLMADWNDLAAKHGYPKLRRLDSTSGFWKSTKARLESKAWRDDYREALELIPTLTMAQPNRTGPRKDWKVNFEWFIRPETVDKILNGAYDRVKQPIGYNADSVTDEEFFANGN